MQFKTEVNDLLQLMIHSLYSNKEIFLRELISNASDACDKRSLARAAGSDDGQEALEIKISCDEEAKLLIIEDSGCGMSKEELENNLGTIARSGTKAFMKEHSNSENAANSELIGQFGVGFYSAFMVANRIEVYSRAMNDTSAHCWSSDATGYEITPAQKDSVGTKIVLHLKESEYASYLRIEHLVKKYSKHINYAIWLNKPEQNEQNADKKAMKYEQINSATAIWKQNKASLKDEDYEQFYAELNYGAKPLGWVHTASEGALEYNALFYIPQTARADLFQMDYERQCKLYVRRVLISEKEELLPVWLRFISGVIDVADLDLNVSREILQDDAKIKKISQISAKKILSAIAALDAEKRKTFNEQFGAVLKEGLLDPNAASELIYKALDFTTSAGQMSLAEYVKNHANSEKKEIYFIQAPSKAACEQNALVSNFSAVIYLFDRVDEFIAANLPEYEGYKWVNITEASITSELANAEQMALAAAIKHTLGAKVKEVKFSSSLGDKLAAIVFDSNDSMYQMQKMMARFNPSQNASFVGDLLLNSEHGLIKKALKALSSEQLNQAEQYQENFGKNADIGKLADNGDAGEGAGAAGDGAGAAGESKNDDGASGEKAPKPELKITPLPGQEQLAHLCFSAAALASSAPLDDLQPLLQAAEYFAMAAHEA